MDGMDATNEPLQDAETTEQLCEVVRQRFLAFLGGFTLHDDEDSRSQLTHASAQTPGSQPPRKPYVEQVPSPASTGPYPSQSAVTCFNYIVANRNCCEQWAS